MDNEKYIDPLDVASRNESILLETQIKDQRALAKPQQLPRKDGSYEFTDCRECGDPIGEQRLKVAIKNLYCIYCATAQERKSK